MRLQGYLLVRIAINVASSKQFQNSQSEIRIRNSVKCESQTRRKAYGQYVLWKRKNNKKCKGEDNQREGYLWTLFLSFVFILPSKNPLDLTPINLKTLPESKKETKKWERKKKWRLLFLELVCPGRISFVERTSTASRSIIVFPSSRSSCHEGCFLVVPPAI